MPRQIVCLQAHAVLTLVGGFMIYIFHCNCKLIDKYCHGLP